MERLGKDGGLHQLVTARGTIRAHRLILATNGYTPERLHAELTGRLLPVISRVVTTRPLSQEEIEAQGWTTRLGCGTTHATLFYYRLLPDGRLMFGGPGDTTGSPAAADRAQAALVAAMRARFPAWRDVPITHGWRGLVCTSLKFAPSVGGIEGDPTLLYGLGYHGNGVAAATWTGRQLALVASGRTSLKDAFPTVMLGLGRRFPLPRLRPLYLRAALGLMRLRD